MNKAAPGRFFYGISNDAEHKKTRNPMGSGCTERLWQTNQAVPQKVTSGNLSLASSRLLALPSSCQ